MKRIVKGVFGLLALVIGVAILVWCGYCLFFPNEHFHWRLIDIPRLVMPLAMIWVGWRWIRGEAPKGERYTSEITVSLKLSSRDFGTESERQAILDLKHHLEDKLQAEQLGEIDGEEFGNGECSIYVHTNVPAKTEHIIREFLTGQAPSLSYSLATANL